MLVTGYVGWTIFLACPRVQATATPTSLEVIHNIVSDDEPGDWHFGASTAQQIRTKIDALPTATNETGFCASEDGSTFRFIFRRGTIVVLQATTKVGGCFFLNLSGCDTRQMDEGFILLIDRLLNVPSI
jgi:hypothetical protein